MRLLDVQAAIYAALAADATLAALVSGVYDNVPKNVVFPYVAIGDGTSVPFDTCSTLGDDQTIDIHTWTQAETARGRRDVKQIQEAIYDVLHWQDLAGLGGLVSIEQEMAQDFIDPDGLTRHGVQRFRVMIENVEGD